MPKPKLTPEEKKALKAKKKAEKKRLAEQKKRQINIDYLEREIKYGELTIEKHEKEWKAMLLKISSENMKKDLDYAWHNFERAIDAKNFTINLLMDEIKQSEEQALLNIKNHIENFDHLINTFQKQLYEIKFDYEIEIDNMIKTNVDECDKLMATFKDNEQFFKMMVAGLQEARKQFITNTMGDYISRLNEEAERFNDIILLMKTVLQMQLEDVWAESERVLQMNQKLINEKFKRYIQFNEADIQMHVLLDAQRVKIETSQEQIKNLKQLYHDLVYLETNRINELLNEREFYADTFWKLKTQLSNETTQDNKNLMLLSIESNAIIKYLQEIEKKGAKILMVSSVCRKFETQMEKVLAFPKQLPAGTRRENIEEIQEDFQFNLDDLRYFWQRVAQADAVRFSMQEEIECLNKQNLLLKKKIHEYCECLNCPPLKKLEDERVVDNTTSVIDCNFEIRKYNFGEKK